MEKSDDPNYLNRLAKKLLHHLDVDVPNTKKIDYATIILSIIGTLSEELKFEEVLSTQEFECLYWTINGCDQNQIAKVMNIKRGTVKEYQMRIKNKYHSKTIAQGIYKGIKYHSLKRNYESLKESLQEIAEGIILLMNEIK